MSLLPLVGPRPLRRRADCSFGSAETPVVPALALRLTILTARRTSEVLGATYPHVFPGRLMKSLSDMTLAVLSTTHGFRTSFRKWAGEQMGERSVAFEVAEAVLAHTIGNQASQSYNRTTMLERRRPVMQNWANYVSPSADNMVLFRAAAGE